MLPAADRPARSSCSSTASATTCWSRPRGKGLMPTVARWLGDAREAAASGARAGHAPPHPVAHRLVQPDRRQPARHPARQQRRRARLPLVREGQRGGDGLQPADQRRRAPAPRRRHAAGHGGLLTVDGASRGNLFTGGADELALVLSIAARRRSRETRSRAGYFAYFSDPANAVRTALSFVAEVVREIGQSTRARLRRDTPRVGRGGLYPFVRAFATVVERDVVVAAVIGRHARRPHRRLRRPGRVRRGRPPLRAAQPGRRAGARPAGPVARADRQASPSTPRAPTGSCCSPTTARAPARPSQGRTG